MIVNCVAYQDGQKLADIAAADISEYVSRPECFVWVALKDPAPEELALLQDEFDLHHLSVEDVLKGHQRPKIEEYGDSLFAVLHNLELREGELHVAEVDLFVGPNFILSVRKGTEQGFTAVRARTEREPELLRHGSGFVFYALIDAVVDRYFPVVDALEVELEALEGRIFAGDLAAREPRGALRPEAEAHDREARRRPPHRGGRASCTAAACRRSCHGTQEYFRDVYDHLLRAEPGPRQPARHGHHRDDVNLAMISLAENEVTKRLAAYGALVAVPTMIAGIYGMNFEHIPELKWLLGYPLAVAAMVAIDAYLFYRFRQARWL